MENPETKVWTENQPKLVPQYPGKLEKAAKGRQQPLKMWIVLKTLQIPLADPAATLMLAGRRIIRLLRQKAIAFVFDKAAKLFRCDANGKWTATNVWTQYHMAFLVSTDATWIPQENVACSYVTNAKASKRIADQWAMTFRFLTSVAMSDANSFCRDLNEQPGDVGTKTAMRQSEFPCREIRKLPKPDEHTELYGYQLPEMYREKLMQTLSSRELNMRYIEVSIMKGLFVLQQAKPKDPKSKGSAQSAEDHVYEVCAALQEEPPKENATLSPRSQRFPQTRSHTCIFREPLW